MLIQVKAPVPMNITGERSEGMVIGASVEPGRPPPWIIPHCHKCQVPVEMFTVDWIASPFYLPLQFTCHGKTSGMRIPYSDVMRMQHTHEPIWVFTETKLNGKQR